MKTLYLYLLFTFFFNCASNNTTEICDCYSKRANGTIDEKLNDCLGDNAKGKNADEARLKIKSTMKSLVENCTVYRRDFNKLSYYRFETGYPDLVSQKDSIAFCINNNIERPKNYNKLAEIYIRLNSLDLAMKNIDQSIKLSPSVSHSHWVKSYIFYKKKDIPNAVKEMIEASRFTTDDDSKYFTELQVIALKNEK
ncbi:hypothetical protein HYN48_14010 [Flavobacterium magnum]|uniref:Uncharacterized protein n=1 Tax=Flavobacterium magnum TaxID=2162713 RepID=A0A2S0RHG3_9FLAO|nr:hypothetical protein [Flavobacterium magnum]AWA31114.1 hypothetical protein HYN48_14010 [Flavobacterium magnum]